MSQKSRRRALDRYLTPDWATKALMQRFPEIHGESLLDPCCGDGRMAQALGLRFQRLFLNDIDADAPAHTCLDGASPHLPSCDWEISNPPFTCAAEIVAAALRRAKIGVAMLLRCTFGEPCGPSHIAPRNGRQWLTQRPPTALLMLPRISFTGDGATDSAPCWWFIWSEAVRPRIIVADRETSAGQQSLALGGIQ